MGFEPTTSCIRGKRLPLDHEGLTVENDCLTALANRVNSRRFLESLPYARWCLAGAFVKKYFQGVLILALVLFVLYREALVFELLRRLPRMQEVVGSNPTEGKICFSQFTLFYRMECEKLFCKTNIKLKVLKLNILFCFVLNLAAYTINLASINFSHG